MAIIAGLAGSVVFIFATLLFLIIGWGWDALWRAWIAGFVTIIIFLILGRNAPRYFDDEEEFHAEDEKESQGTQSEKR